MAAGQLKTLLYLAARFVTRHRRKTIATGGFILAGTAMLVLLNSITAGINDTMVLNTTSIHYGHAFARIEPGGTLPENIMERVSSQDYVEAVLLRYSFTTIAAANKTAAPVVVYAVDPESESERTAIAGRIVAGRYPVGSSREILIGFGTAEKLGVVCGDRVAIYKSPVEILGSFSVSGIYRTEIEHFDSGVSFVSAASLGADFRNELAAELSVFFGRTADKREATARLNEETPRGPVFKSWDELMPDLVQLIHMNEISMRILMTFVFVLVGFGISNTFILTIVERFREFGILKSLGVTPRELVILVFLESFTVCLAATFLGLLAGWLATNLIAYNGIDFGAFTSHNRYFVVTGIVRPRITLSGMYWPGLMAIAVSIVSSYLPARIAARKMTSETLRFS